MKRLAAGTAALLAALLAGPARAETSAEQPDSARCAAAGNRDPGCVDVSFIAQERERLIGEPYRTRDFITLESNVAQWCQGSARFPDGSFRAAHYVEAFEHAWAFNDTDQERIALWKASFPKSASPLFAEALMWHAHAWHVRGRSMDHAIAREALEIFNESLARSDKILSRLSTRMQACPAWHALRITVLVDRQKTAAARTAFDAAVTRFPLYQPLYFAMGRAYEPRRGGDGSQFEALADQAVSLTSGAEGSGMYARMYGRVDTFDNLAFNPQRSAIPRWDKLHAAYEDLLKRWPSSQHHLNKYAAAACRSDDAALYRKLRTSANAYLLTTYFSVVPVDACDLRHGWR